MYVSFGKSGTSLQTWLRFLKECKPADFLPGRQEQNRTKHLPTNKTTTTTKLFYLKPPI